MQRIADLYPDRYEPNYHFYVFADIRELSFISLITKRKDVASVDSRAVGIWDINTPFTPDEARNILSWTKFISTETGDWEVEVQSTSHAGTLVEATSGGYSNESAEG